jgi:hypothetical protein
MALDDLVGSNINNTQFIDPGVGQFNPPPQGGLGIHNQQFIDPGYGQFNPIKTLLPSDPGNLPMGQHPLMGMPPAVTDANIGGNSQNFIPMNPNDPALFRRLDGPLSSMDTLNSNFGPNIGNIKNPGTGNFNLPGPISQMPGMPPLLQTVEPDYSSQFENFGKQLGGFGEQLTGYQDALGGFNEQIGGMGKQFETISNRLDSVDKGLGSLGNQIASLENMQKAQPQQVMQPQRPMFNPFSSPFGFGGLGSLFGRRY